MASLAWEPGMKLGANTPRIDPEELMEERETSPVYVWNVSPYEFREKRGTLGEFVIPGCPVGKEVSAPLVIPGWIRETAVDSVEGRSVQLKWLRTSGKSIARDIIGEGIGKHPSQQYMRYGVFVSKGPKPTDEELTAAHARLNDYYSNLVKQADDLYSVNQGMVIGDDGRPHQMITRYYIDAANALGIKRPWAQGAQKSLVCPECGESNMPMAARCKNSECRCIFDEAKARQRFPEMFMVEEPVRRGPGRPRSDA